MNTSCLNFFTISMWLIRVCHRRMVDRQNATEEAQAESIREHLISRTASTATVLEGGGKKTAIDRFSCLTALGKFCPCRVAC